MGFAFIQKETICEVKKIALEDTVEFEVTNNILNLADLNLIKLQIEDGHDDDPFAPMSPSPIYLQIENEIKNLRADYAVLNPITKDSTYAPVIYFRKK